MFNLAFELASLSTELLMSSSLLLERALEIGDAGTAMGPRAIEAIALIREIRRSPVTSPTLDLLREESLAVASATVQAAANRAGSAAVEIRALTGGQFDPLHRHFSLTRAVRTTMVDIEECLSQLSQHVSEVTQLGDTCYTEINEIQSRIAVMLGEARRNRAVAVEAAKAVEWLNLEATSFLRALKVT